jgi:hypothetical protein
MLRSLPRVYVDTNAIILVMTKNQKLKMSWKMLVDMQTIFAQCMVMIHGASFSTLMIHQRQNLLVKNQI